MAVIAVFEHPTLTRESYETSILRLAGKEKAESPSDWPVPGLIAHIAGDTGNGFRVVDVWESEEALGRFAEALKPVMQEIGIEAEPQIYPGHTIVTA